MENKELFSNLMDMWAAHYNSFDELRAVYDVVHDFATGIIIHDEAVYASKKGEKTRKAIQDWANAAEKIYAEMFCRCTGCTLKKNGYAMDTDPYDVIDGDIIGQIIEGYATHLRKNGIFEDAEYKEEIWNKLQSDPSVFR